MRRKRKNQVAVKRFVFFVVLLFSFLSLNVFFFFISFFHCAQAHTLARDRMSEGNNVKIDHKNSDGRAY